MSVEDRIRHLLQAYGLEAILEFNEIDQEELVEYLLEEGQIELPETHELEGFPKK